MGSPVKLSVWSRDSRSTPLRKRSQNVNLKLRCNVETIPNIRDSAFGSTDHPMEPQHGVVYRVGTPGKMTRTYVNVTKIYGDRGIARCRVIKSFEDDGTLNPEREGKILNVGFEHLHEPDIYPKFAYSTELWASKASMSIRDMKVTASELIDGYFNTQAIAFDLREDGEKVVKAIKTLLTDYFGPFLLTFLLAFVKRRIDRVVQEREGKPTPKKTFERKMSDMKRLFSKPLPKPNTDSKKAK